MPAIPYIALGFVALGMVSTASNQIQKGKAQQKAYEQNAEISRQNAIAVEKQTAYEEEKQKEKADALKSRQRALYAKAGVDITSGSPLLVMLNDMESAEEDLQAIRYTGDVKKTSYLNQAGMQEYYGEQAEQAGKKEATGTIIGGLGTMGMNYMKMKGKGSYYGYW